MVWIVILVIVALLVIALITLYNRFVRLRNRVDNAWAQIEVQLKRRWDLIPNLVETVKGYAEHGRGTFEAVTEARERAAGAGPGRDGRRRASSAQRWGGSSRSPRRIPGSRRTETFASSRTSSPGRRTGSPCHGRSTTTPSSPTTTRSRRSRASCSQDHSASRSAKFAEPT